MSPLTTALRATSALVLSLAAVGARAETRACTDLLSVDLTDVGGTGSRVTSATRAEDRGVAVCAIEGTLAPAIGFKVQLPLRTWAGRYLQAGCGGLCGQASLRVGAADGCAPLAAGGFVIASTDMGHQGRGGEFGKDPQKREDFAHRGVHLTAVAAKKLIRAFYGRDAERSYFTGCSDGGREALVEAQRYPVRLRRHRRRRAGAELPGAEQPVPRVAGPVERGPGREGDPRRAAPGAPAPRQWSTSATPSTARSTG